MQERSNDTVQHIFQAASELLGKTPLEQITTSRIAHQAGISVGALYRFFPDKQAIIDAIATRHMEEFSAGLEARLGEATPANGREFLNMVIDAYVTFLDARPDFRSIALGRHVSAATRQRQAEPDAGPTALVKMFLVVCLGVEESVDLDLKLRVAVEVGERLIAYAYAQSTKAVRLQVIAEMKRLLGGYLFGESTR